MMTRFFQSVGDTYVVGLVRVALGLLLFWNALRAGYELRVGGYFGHAFHMPMIPEALVPSALVYTVIIAAQILSAALVTVGHHPRGALFLSSIVGVYVLLCDRLQFHHNRYALFCFAFVLAFAPCDRTFVITAPPDEDEARAGVGPLWAQRLAQVQLCIVYLSSGGSKLLDPDWRAGLVIGDRFARYGHQALERGVPQAVVDFMSRADVTSALSKIAIATELSLVVALWLRRTRVLALWWAVMFHLTIEVTSKVELFTWLSLAILCLFATPDRKARKLFYDPTRARGRILAKAVAALDWLARFDVRPWEPDALKKGHSLVVVGRDGSRATGLRAVAMVARCVPLLFPLWAPIALASSFTRGAEPTLRG
jgi:hypothetical protein